MIVDIVETEKPTSLAGFRDFMKLPIDERRRILNEQAQRLFEHYEHESLRHERELWQGGEIVEL
jgi:hypothetical protein